MLKKIFWHQHCVIFVSCSAFKLTFQDLLLKASIKIRNLSKLKLEQNSKLLNCNLHSLETVCTLYSDLRFKRLFGAASLNLKILLFYLVKEFKVKTITARQLGLHT